MTQLLKKTLPLPKKHIKIIIKTDTDQHVCVGTARVCVNTTIIINTVQTKRANATLTACRAADVSDR